MGRCLQCGSRGRSLAGGQRGTWGKRERGSPWKPRSLSPWEAIRPFPQMSSFKTARPCEYILHYSHFANKELTSWGGKTTQLDHGRGRCAFSQAPVLPGSCTQESKPGLLGIKWLFLVFSLSTCLIMGDVIATAPLICRNAYYVLGTVQRV